MYNMLHYRYEIYFSSIHIFTQKNNLFIAFLTLSYCVNLSLYLLYMVLDIASNKLKVHMSPIAWDYIIDV